MKKGFLLVMLAMALLLGGCGYLSTPTKYVTTDGLQIDTTDDGAYYMTMRDIEIVGEKSFNEALSQPGLSDQQIFALSLAHAYRRHQQVDKPTSWIDSALKLYPIVRDGLQILTGGFGDQTRSDSSSRVSAGRDVYIESSGNSNNGQDYQFTGGESFSPNIDNSFGFSSSTDASDSSAHPDSYSLF